MALIICPECKKEVSDQAEVCIHCGYPLKKEEEKFTKRYAVIMNDPGAEYDFVLNLVREVSKVSELEAKEICTKTPKTIKADLSESQAKEIKSKFESFGAKVEIDSYDVSAMMLCPGCGKMISKEAYECPYCGHSVKERPTNLGTIILGVCIAILIMSFL